MVQEDYEAACLNVFDALDKMEQRLEGQRYLIPYYPGGQATPSPTLADYRLFTTLIRFDVVYYLLFKTNIKHIRDYPNLQVACCHSNGVDKPSPLLPPTPTQLDLQEKVEKLLFPGLQTLVYMLLCVIGLLVVKSAEQLLDVFFKLVISLNQCLPACSAILFAL